MKTREPRWIEERDALAIHDRLLALHGGATGLRDQGLLESAMARPRQHYAYARRSEIVALSALYTAGIVRNHPFVDGNKRAGFVIGVLFLELQGYELTASEEDATQAVLGLAAGTLDETSYTHWLRSNVKRKRGRAKAKARRPGGNRA
ncbi:MAG TPA: type II toxin-antitoxin system death-on-curing family toxin [Terriglobales bacterium]|nr:type II toxin-antitoxin system death-on-curing family toxin [Terriglobales bacterium]